MNREDEEQGKKREYAHQKGSPLHGQVQKDRPTLQGTGRAWVEGLPLPWRPRWSTQGQGQSCMEAWALQRESEGRASTREAAPKGCLKPSEAAP